MAKLTGREHTPLLLPHEVGLLYFYLSGLHACISEAYVARQDMNLMSITKKLKQEKNTGEDVYAF